MQRRHRRIIALLALSSPLLFAASDRAYNGALQMLSNALSRAAQMEPDRVGPLHDVARGRTVITHNPTPAVRFISPANGGEFEGYLAVQIANWTVDPTKAVNAGTQFANGYQERNTGHTHTWIYNANTNVLVRFTGANGLALDQNTGLYVSAPFNLPPGTYKVYVQLQNHDHTGAIPASAPSLPPFDAVQFVVSP